MKAVVVIPAYNPTKDLIGVVRELAASRVPAIIVVDDGSTDASSARIFEAISGQKKVILLKHAVNVGKGAALKTGLNHAACNFPDAAGVVTADADGQHLACDILKVAERLENNPGSLVLGARKFDRQVPLRSALGNAATRLLFRILVGKKLTDTQTGLRGIPSAMIPRLLNIESNRYEFELDMLISARRYHFPILEQEIRTVYIDGNRSSSFDPLLDSMRIYFVLCRFMLASLATAAVDYFIFIELYDHEAGLGASQFAARAVALVVNYTAVKQMVFYSDLKHREVFPRFVALVAVSGLVSYGLINTLLTFLSINIVAAKIMSELIVYLGNFAVQRDFIFTGGSRKAKTDWDAYYAHTYKTAAFSKKITAENLVRLMEKSGCRGKTIAELGGANSCFFDQIREKLKPSEYHIIDNNLAGLDKFHKRALKSDPGSGAVFLHNQDVLNLHPDNLKKQVDVVFSVGLIEHFSVEDTRKAIESHFKLLKSEGILILSFPTPTPLYRLTRFMSEILGMWIFHDERPLTREEVIHGMAGYGTVLHEKIVWPILLTQFMIVARKKI